MCFILVHSIPVYSQTYGNYMPSSYSTNNDCTDYPAVSGLENSVFGRTFQNESIYLRISRLESNMLGTTFPQEALCDRIDRISKATAGGNSYSYNTLNPSWQNMANSFSNNSSYNNQSYGTPQNSSGIMNILENIVLPIISNYAGSNFNNSSFYNSPYYQQDYYQNQNLNYGAGVRILP